METEMKRFAAIMIIAALMMPVFASGEDTVEWKGISYPISSEYVELKDDKIDIDELITFLKQFPELKKADMFETPVDRAKIDALTEALPDVTFGWTMTVPCTNPAHPERKAHYIRTDAEVFSTLHNNRCTLHTDEDLSILKYCTNMLALDIGHNALTDLSFIACMPRLRVLIIGRNKITDLTPLENCPDLEYLEAFTNDIASVEPLLKCTHLMYLNIPNNKVQDPELFAQMTWLKKLWAFNYFTKDLNNDRVPGNIKQLVRESLPDCRVNWSSSGNGGGFKDDMIVEMFDTGVYIPFADGLAAP